MQELEDLEERLARGILCRPDAASDTLPHNANLSLWVLHHVFPYKSTHVFVLGDSFFVCHVIDNHVVTSSLYKTLVILKCLRSKKNKNTCTVVQTDIIQRLVAVGTKKLLHHRLKASLGHH